MAVAVAAVKGSLVCKTSVLRTINSCSIQRDDGDDDVDDDDDDFDNDLLRKHELLGKM